MNTDITRSLARLLEDERRAILDGQLDSLARIAERKARLVTDLGAEPEVDLSGLRLKAERNQELLESALHGIREVAERLKEMRAARSGLETYDSHGQRRTMTADTGNTVERRA